MRTVIIGMAAFAILMPAHILAQGPGSSSAPQPATTPGAPGRADRPDMGPRATTDAQAPAPAGSNSGADTPMQNNSSVGDDRTTNSDHARRGKARPPR